MTHEPSLCSVCSARVKDARITFTQELNGQFFVVRDVPAQVCGQCSEQYLSPETVDVLHDLIERGSQRLIDEDATIQVPVFQYRKRVA